MAAGDRKESGSFLKEIVQNFTAHPAGRLPNNWIVYKCPKNGKLVIVGFAEARKIKMVKFGLCSSISDLQTQSVLQMLIAIAIAEEIQGLQKSLSVISEIVGDVYTEQCCYFGHVSQERA